MIDIVKFIRNYHLVKQLCVFWYRSLWFAVWSQVCFNLRVDYDFYRSRNNGSSYLSADWLYEDIITNITAATRLWPLTSLGSELTVETAPLSCVWLLLWQNSSPSLKEETYSNKTKYCIVILLGDYCNFLSSNAVWHLLQRDSFSETTIIFWLSVELILNYIHFSIQIKGTFLFSLIF